MTARPDTRAAWRGIEMPESLRDGECRTAHGLIAMDDYADNPKSATATRRAKAVCESCPVHVRRDCQDYIRRAEPIPGAWPVMYAGLTPQERRQRARRGA